jgi:hypothetical protein
MTNSVIWEMSYRRSGLFADLSIVNHYCIKVDFNIA